MVPFGNRNHFLMSKPKAQKRLTTEPYKGTRDFYPDDFAVQRYIFNTWRKVVERFGYEEYNAPLIEETDLYRAKTGEEIVNEQTYTFRDRGERDVTIRPEMTPSVARMVARKRQELAFPLRWYSIPNLFRYERPQRGRLREHWQLNVDYFGPVNNFVEMEIIDLASQIMQEFGASEEQYEIRLNSRKLTNEIMQDIFSLNSYDAIGLTKLIDRKNKMELDEFLSKAEEILGDKSESLNEILEAKETEDLPKELQESQSVKDIMKTIETLNARGIGNIVFDASLMRGFDYYTGMVFEIFDVSPKNNRSLFGGGRYDDLVGIFGAEPVPGIGFGMGDVTMRDFLATYNLLPDLPAGADLYLCVLDEESVEETEKMASEFRAGGIRVVVDTTLRKIAKQIKVAEKKSIMFFACVGPDEIKSGKLSLKNIKTREESQVPVKKLAKKITS